MRRFLTEWPCRRRVVTSDVEWSCGVIGDDGFEILEERASGDTERLCDVEKSFVEQAPLAAFHLDEHRPAQVGGVRQLFLRQSPLQAQRPDPGTDRRARRLPCGRTVGIMLAGASWHAPQSSRGNTKSLYH